MNFKSIAVLATAAAVSATASLAQNQNPAIDAIVADLQALGYSRIEITTGPRGIEVEALGADGQLERRYTADGVLVREETQTDGVQTERVYDADGNIISETTDDGTDDDGYDDENDDGNDDENDDGDDGDDGDDDEGDDDNGDDDEGDDDEGDDD